MASPTERRYSTETTAGVTTQPPQHLRNHWASTHLSTAVTTPSTLTSHLLCGPLLRYTNTDYTARPAPVWNGSVLVVVANTPPPVLSYEGGRVQGVKIHEERGRGFYRFLITAPLGEVEREVRYTVGFGERGEVRRAFWVPGREQSMRIMFHSCNGFSVGSDEESFSGPAVWNDVLRVHEKRPLHVMIGGGDQIYSDGIRVTGPLRPWAEKMKNPIKRRKYPWTDSLDADVDEWYCNNYLDWYSTVPFSHANSQIAQINIWDDHDIIDGYGSYRESTMQSPVFKGVGRISHKYYLLFQHHTPPAGESPEDPSFILGSTPGPYMSRPSRSIYSRLGHSIAFLGVDARTERTRHQINLPETYDTCFSRLNTELSRAPEVKHLILLLGVPIAYPRLVWLEMFLSSPILKLIGFFHKHFGLADGLFNKFDGKPDLADDLDDHYCARTHKVERNDLIHRLQSLSIERGVRVTILSGDVHLAAVGRFYSVDRLNIPVQHDHRYIVNIISSAITNKPPPAAVANLLAKRNKHHKLDDKTDEQLLEMFERDVDGKERNGNKVTQPRRNYAIITEGVGEGDLALDDPTLTPTTAAVNGDTANGTANGNDKTKRKNGKRNWRGKWEQHAGQQHPSAQVGVATEEEIGIGRGTLNVAIRVEREQSRESGETVAYGFAIPPLISMAANNPPTTAEPPVDQTAGV
ncbi:hypothetical protein EX30DRAFT_322021 [Ascodesmis nigricans]|uniref:PhoD-like phosphatase domain-containing protein n=1 Tax=Ascodesmis nigricans TaxID=341454 RepID=A0A4S2MNR0_9PEZI|nr:hypothetical protein EX30DRAFT_322021 [Ascodesmis nigricans]